MARRHAQVDRPLHHRHRAGATTTTGCGYTSTGGALTRPMSMRPYKPGWLMPMDTPTSVAARAGRPTAARASDRQIRFMREPQMVECPVLTPCRRPRCTAMGDAGVSAVSPGDAVNYFQAKCGCSKCATRVGRPHRHSSRNWYSTAAVGAAIQLSPTGMRSTGCSLSVARLQHRRVGAQELGHRDAVDALHLVQVGRHRRAPRRPTAAPA